MFHIKSMTIRAKIIAVFVAILVFGLALAAKFLAENISVVSLLLNMSVLAAMVSYFISLLSYVSLKVRYPLMERPYKSPLGVTGAITSLIIVTVAAFFMFTNSDFRCGLFILASIYIFFLMIFLVFEKKFVNEHAPEEDFAIHLKNKIYLTGDTYD